MLSSLAEIGYDAEWQDIRAEDVGAPHRRERIWIVAYPNEQGEPERAEHERQGQGELVQNSEHIRQPGCEEPRGVESRIYAPGGQSGAEQLAGSDSSQGRAEAMAHSDRHEQGRRDDKVSHTTSDGRQQASIRGQEPSGVAGEDSIARVKESWAVEPNVGRLAHGVRNRVDRLKGLGNAIVPQIAELLFRQIKNQL